jgi:hypothetical protein
MAANDNACTHHPDLLLGEDASETIIESLPFASQFAIWAARAWVTALKLEQPFEAVSGHTFRKLDLLPAEQALDSLFMIIAGSATRPIDIRCLKCRHVSPDEMIFHQALSAAQHGESFAAYNALREWMPPAAARIGFTSLATLASSLAQADLRLAPRVQPQDQVMHQRAMPSLAVH